MYSLRGGHHGLNGRGGHLNVSVLTMDSMDSMYSLRGGHHVSVLTMDSMKEVAIRGGQITMESMEEVAIM